MTIWELATLVSTTFLIIAFVLTYIRSKQAEDRANNVIERGKRLEDGLGSVTKDLIGELKKR